MKKPATSVQPAPTVPEPFCSGPGAKRPTGPPHSTTGITWRSSPNNRPYKTLSRCNQVLIRARHEKELTQKICEILIDSGGYILAWVAYGSKRMPLDTRVMAKAGREEPDVINFRINWTETSAAAETPGLSARVIQEGKIMISGASYCAGDAANPWVAADQREQMSFISLPLQSGSRVFGALNIMTESTFSSSDDEVQLLSELAADLAFGITTIRNRHRHETDIRDKLRLQLQLRQAQKMEAIGTLAGGIAHDFNNLLHAILGYSGLLLRNLPPEDKNYKFSQIIHEAGVSAAGLIGQILTFSRRNEAERQPLQIQQIIKGALRLLRSTLPSTIEFHSRIDMHCRAVLADTTAINQIIMNLGTNAYHAMRQKGGVLEVRLAEVQLDRAEEEKAADLTVGLEELPPGPYLCLQVSDTGTGMDHEVMQRIFDPYFTTKSQEEGTGLGLATTLGITKNLHGAITVKSAPDQGTTFKLLLPVLAQPLPQNDTNAEETIPLIRNLHCKRVLFVDDVEYNVILGEHTLGQLGCEVAGFTCSREALELFQQFPDLFDLVITDQTMPKLTGFEMASQMLDIRPEIPIVLITGYSDLVDEETALAAGIHSFIIKPLDLGSISRVLWEIFPPAT